MSSQLRIIVTGLIAQHPTLAGVSWDYVQYVAGLARLGHDVYYFEDSGEWPYDTTGDTTGSASVAYDPTRNVGLLNDVMSRFGLEDRWAYRCASNGTWYGLAARERRSVRKTADLLLNVSGTLHRPAAYREIPRLAYIDSDPVFTQVKFSLPHGQKKFRKRVNAHDVHFTFGEGLSDTWSSTGHTWRPTRQPVVLSEWLPAKDDRGVYTTVMSWTSYRPLRFRRQTYGQKDVEFRRFLDLPSMVTPVKLEVALGGDHHADWERGTDPSSRLSPREVLSRRGWTVVDPIVACPDMDRYREYISGSRAEWSVAKHGYVAGNSGWFSCRSACYLASSKPVVVEDTGYSRVLPVGEGILPFTSVEEAVAGIEEVERRYKFHAKRAHEIAVEYFDSDRVLTRLIDEAMNAPT